MSTYLLRKGRASEDAFTGMLADLLAWWPEHALAMFEGARVFDGRLQPARGLDGSHDGAMTVRDWPQWPSGEPDIVLEFELEHTRSLVIVEAKLGAPKSGADVEPAGPEETNDQLAKYYRDAAAGKDRRSGPVPARVDVVYLTHHTIAPENDLAASLAAMRSGAAIVPGELYWISWTEVHATLRRALAYADGPRARALASAAAVLERGGYAGFTGAWEPRGAFRPAKAEGWFPRWSWHGPDRLREQSEASLCWRGT